jgi:hypothetical protein
MTMLPAMNNAGGDILDDRKHNYNHELNEIRNERLAASLRRERDATLTMDMVGLKRRGPSALGRNTRRHQTLPPCQLQNGRRLTSIRYFAVISLICQ